MDFASPGPVPAPVTTIAWRLAHIIVSCLGYRVGWHFGGQDVDSETFAYAGVRELSDADLENPPAAPRSPSCATSTSGRTELYRATYDSPATGDRPSETYADSVTLRSCARLK